PGHRQADGGRAVPAGGVDRGGGGGGGAAAAALGGAGVRAGDGQRLRGAALRGAGGRHRRGGALPVAARVPPRHRPAAGRAAPRGDAAPEPWMAWIAGYHELMRSALAVRTGGGAGTDPAFAAAVRAPPGGRVSVLVLRALAARFDVDAAEIARVLFPLRRPSP